MILLSHSHCCVSLKFLCFDCSIIFHCVRIPQAIVKIALFTLMFIEASFTRAKGGSKLGVYQQINE